MKPHIKLLSFKPIIGLKGSFAHFTIKERLPAILSRLHKEFKRVPSVQEKLEQLNRNILVGKIGEIPLAQNDDWEYQVNKYLDLTWFEAPFYFIETYFYQLVLEALDYFNTGIDPFLSQKRQDIKANIAVMNELAFSIQEDSDQVRSEVLKELLYQNLWGNKADLSQLKVDRNSKPTNHCVIDDTRLVLEYLEGDVKRIDIVLDNAGLELFTDLLLATWLLKLGYVEQIMLHTKAHPTFVSDATESDIDVLMRSLKEDERFSDTSWIKTFYQYKTNGQIVIKSHEFWNTPLHFFEMPSNLHEDLANSDLLIFKGDANYRRIFGDRIIPMNESADQYTNYLPTRSLAVRILKSEILLGLNDNQKRVLNRSDQDWLTGGKYGIIQMLNE